ncbi:MAG: hypothetical protein K5695_06895, partial [Oscillospiraceae bacterium]|nr:hypothetical protein [Oscillospiraceae bacterium]
LALYRRNTAVCISYDRSTIHADSPFFKKYLIIIASALPLVNRNTEKCPGFGKIHKGTAAPAPVSYAKKVGLYSNYQKILDIFGKIVYNKSTSIHNRLPIPQGVKFKRR